MKGWLYPNRPSVLLTSCYAQALGVVDVGSLSVELSGDKGTQQSSLLSCLSKARTTASGVVVKVQGEVRQSA